MRKKIADDIFPYILPLKLIKFLEQGIKYFPIAIEWGTFKNANSFQNEVQIWRFRRDIRHSRAKETGISLRWNLVSRSGRPEKQTWRMTRSIGGEQPMERSS